MYLNYIKEILWDFTFLCWDEPKFSIIEGVSPNPRKFCEAFFRRFLVKTWVSKREKF